MKWDASNKILPAQWLCALTHDGAEMRLGVVSARRRAVPNTGAVIGILMDEGDESKGVVISSVTEESPAEKAGLQAKDVLLSIDGQKVTDIRFVKRTLAKYRAGDVVKVHYLRQGKPADCEVRLVSRSRVRMGADDFANHGTSVRTDNFSDVIQHDMPLAPEDMGAALYDLQGRAIGINIARVDRVTNYALPSEAFVKELDAWIKADSKQN